MPYGKGDASNSGIPWFRSAMQWQRNGMARGQARQPRNVGWGLSYHARDYASPVARNPTGDNRSGCPRHPDTYASGQRVEVLLLRFVFRGNTIGSPVGERWFRVLPCGIGRRIVVPRRGRSSRLILSGRANGSDSILQLCVRCFRVVIGHRNCSSSQMWEGRISQNRMRRSGDSE